MVVDHGDLGPWNVVRQGGRVVGVIDWDLARFGDPLDDLAQLALETVPLKPSTADRLDLMPGRRRLLGRLRSLCTAHGGVTEHQLLVSTTAYLERIAREVEELGRTAREPFRGFLRDGFSEDYRAEARHITSFFLS